jgi:prepilin-type processing-associated H-X9-DG protein
VPSEGPNAISSTNYMPNAVIVGKRVTSVRHPSDTIVLQEDKMLWCVCWLRPAPSGSGSGGPLYTDWHWNGDGFGEEYTAIHSNLSGGNVLYVDCHADFRQYQSLHAYDFGLAGGSGASGAASDPDTCSNFGTYYGSP